ncbi:MAG: hypothetical protein HYW25_05325 [Candidatus Aenigmarchaeota archaeon]|nr:hypothetical protein [Candidatus Aenigmarchaeota archaeon]
MKKALALAAALLLFPAAHANRLSYEEILENQWPEEEVYEGIICSEYFGPLPAAPSGWADTREYRFDLCSEDGVRGFAILDFGDPEHAKDLERIERHFDIGDRAIVRIPKKSPFMISLTRDRVLYPSHMPLGEPLPRDATIFDPLRLRELEDYMHDAGNAGLAGINADFDVLVVADAHDNIPIRNDLARRIGELKMLGIKAYGAEAPVEFSIEFEKVSNGESLPYSEGYDFGPGSESLGPLSKFSYQTLGYKLAEEGINIFPFVPSSKRLNREDDQSYEEAMAAEIERNFRRYGKSMILVGADHAIRGTNSIVDYLEKRGVRCTTVLYCGGWSDNSECAPVEIASERAGRTNDIFQFANAPRNPLVNFDHVIHLRHADTPDR